jgi:hypothetical protein
VIESCHHGVVLAEGACQANGLDERVSFGELLAGERRIIGAPVVDQDYLEGVAVAEVRAELLDEIGNRPFTAIDGDYDTKVHGI